MMRRIVLGAFLLVAVSGLIVGAIVLNRQLDSTPAPPTRKPAAALSFVETTSWQETHATIELHAQVTAGPRDTAFMSKAIALLPADLAKNGTTLHFLVTVPDWAVFDESGNLYEGADGVVLVASNPDLGIGLELTRLELNPSRLATDRTWRPWEVKVPPCTQRIALEALPGSAPEANNFFDRLRVNVTERLVFQNANAIRPDARPSAACPDLDSTTDCASGASSDCRRTGSANRIDPPTGALHTGSRQ